jgi:putative transposase
VLHDRDRIYGESFLATAHSMGIHEVLTSPHSPWQNPYCERLIGSIRRECLDHFIVFNERGLHRTLKSYFEYYEQSRTHLSLDKDAPLTRAIHPQTWARVIELPQLGGFHHRYERRPA